MVLERIAFARPTSPSMRASMATVLSARPEFAAVPDSPPTVIRSSIIDGSQPFESLQDDNTKAESPELGQTLHNIPASGFGSPFNGPERAMIDTRENLFIPPLPPPASQSNGHEYPEYDQELTNPIPFTPQPVTGPLPRKSPSSKLTPQSSSSRHNSRATEVAYKPVRDIYDPLTTATENSPGHPTTPKVKRLKTSAAVSLHSNHHLVDQPLSQSDLSFVANPGSLSRRGSGITEAELNWLHSQEKTICKPSQDSYDYAIDQAVTALSAVPDEDHRFTRVDEENGFEVDDKENSRKAMEGREDRLNEERALQERKAEAERVAKENEERIEHERKVEEDRVAEENRQHAERERKAKADRTAEESRKQAERERKAEADRIAEENRNQVEREEEAEELRLSEQKANEAAAASKANEERIAAEAKENLEHERMEVKLKERKSKERKERDKQSAARKEERRVTKEKEKLVQSEKEAAPKEIAPRPKANEDDKKAKSVGKRSGKKEKPSPQAHVQVEKDRNANEGFLRGRARARASSASSQRQSSTPMSICADTPKDGKKGSSTPLIPGVSRSEQSSSKNVQSSTPGTSRKGTGLEVQMPLPSALKQSPSTQRRSVSWVDSVPKPILPRGTTEDDIARARAKHPQAKGGSANPKTPGKSQASIKKETGGGKVQSKLNVVRDTKLKGRVIDPPAKPKPPVQDEIVMVSSESENSDSPIYSDPEADPRRNGGAIAGPSSRGTPSSRPASAKANFTARIEPVTVPHTSLTKVTAFKPDTPKPAISDNDSIQSFRSESEAGSRSQSPSRSPARYVSQASISRSISRSENEMISPLPSLPNETTTSSTNASHASSPSSHVPQSSGGATEKAHPTSRPSTTSHAQSQPSQASLTQISITTTQSSEFVHGQSVEGDLEAHLQRDISRSSVQPPSSQPRSQNQNRSSAPPKNNPSSKPTQATTANSTPPTKMPSTTSTTQTTQPELRPSTTSRFPTLTGLKKNPPKWGLEDGGAALMPEFMKPKAKPTPPPSSSQNQTGRLFMSPNTQQKYIDLDKSSTESDDDDDSASSSDNDVIITNGEGHESAKLATGGGRNGRNSRTPLTSASATTATPTGAAGRTGASKSKYGSALKRMWPFGSSSQPYEI